MSAILFVWFSLVLLGSLSKYCFGHFLPPPLVTLLLGSVNMGCHALRTTPSPQWDILFEWPLLKTVIGIGIIVADLSASLNTPKTNVCRICKKQTIQKMQLLCTGQWNVILMQFFYVKRLRYIMWFWVTLSCFTNYVALLMPRDELTIERHKDQPY